MLRVPFTLVGGMEIIPEWGCCRAVSWVTLCILPRYSGSGAASLQGTDGELSEPAPGQPRVTVPAVNTWEINELLNSRDGIGRVLGTSHHRRLCHWGQNA